MYREIMYTVYSLFVGLVNRSAGIVLPVAAILVLRQPLKKAPRWLVCAMWAVAAVCLVVPLAVPSPVSVYSFFSPAVTQTGSVEVFYYNGKTEHPLMELDLHALVPPGEEARDESAGTLSVWPQAHDPDLYLPPVVGIWGLGVAAMLLSAALHYRRLRRRLREAVPLQGNIWLCDGIPGAFILGIFRPKIYLSSSLSAAQRIPVIAHERAHLARKDHWWKLLGYILLALHWFNPLLWAAYILFCRDMELACDERAVRDSSPETRRAYAEVLLACGAPGEAVLAFPLPFGEAGIKARVRAVAGYRKSPRSLTAAAAILAAVVLAAFITVPQGGDVRHVEKVTGESTRYTQEELGRIMDTVTDHFHAHFRGCSLTALTYDEAFSQRTCDEWAKTYQADRAVVLLSSFDVYSSGGNGSLNPNSTYRNWQWVLTQEDGGNWKLQTWGYG